MINLLKISNFDIGMGAVIILGVMLWFILIRYAVRADSIYNSLHESQNQQRAATWLLIKLCEKHGVSSDEIESIKKAFNIK